MDLGIVVKVNVDEAIETASKYGIESIPTLIIFKGDEIVKKLVGYTEEEKLLALMEELEQNN